jgi:glucosamine--fructose-6-phosphate aminotransferase (isomerizing)
MCGIVGILGCEPVAPALIDALKRLEYRSYDSAGVATLENGGLARRRAEGKVAQSRGAARGRAAPRHDWHRPHPLGHAWTTDRDQRASSRH